MGQGKKNILAERTVCAKQGHRSRGLARQERWVARCWVQCGLFTLQESWGDGGDGEAGR